MQANRLDGGTTTSFLTLFYCVAIMILGDVMYQGMFCMSQGVEFTYYV